MKNFNAFRILMAAALIATPAVAFAHTSGPAHQRTLVVHDRTPQAHIRTTTAHRSR